jgi:hypothetical protein
MSDVVRVMGRASSGALPRIAGGLLSIPVTAGFLLLGIVVVVGRGMRAGWHAMVRDRGVAEPTPPTRRRAA